MTDAGRLHDHALVIDALVYHTDGWTGDLRAGGIDALNLTVCHFEADFEEACQHIAIWHSILAAPDSEWRQVETTADQHSDVQLGALRQYAATRGLDVAEVYVDRILDRDEFRALCDQHGTREAILAAL